MPLLRHTDIEVTLLCPQPPSSVARAHTWPCPLCGHRRPLRHATRAHVRNRTGPSLQRWILACGECTALLHEQT
ncbi:MAG TPA: hypothetical protein VHF25_09310 [Nitriliruptorales bacterium]|nr:hypothetical protein [Nitriliruptorales bacterium]